MFSPFRRMGLWEYCFDRHRFPEYQYDKLFDGCHYIFGNVSKCFSAMRWMLVWNIDYDVSCLFQELHKIREWLLPAWLMSVQAFVTLALMLSFTAQILLACVIIRFPLRLVLRYEWTFVSISFILVAISSKFCQKMCFV